MCAGMSQVFFHCSRPHLTCECMFPSGIYTKRWYGGQDAFQNTLWYKLQPEPVMQPPLVSRILCPVRLGEGRKECSPGIIIRSVGHTQCTTTPTQHTWTDTHTQNQRLPSQEYTVCGTPWTANMGVWTGGFHKPNVSGCGSILVMSLVQCVNHVGRQRERSRGNGELHGFYFNQQRTLYLGCLSSLNLLVQNNRVRNKPQLRSLCQI